MFGLGIAVRARRAAGWPVLPPRRARAPDRRDDPGCALVLWLFVITVFFVELAIIAGWWTAEIGRQPWIVYNVLLTADGVSPVLSAERGRLLARDVHRPVRAPARSVPVPAQREDPARTRSRWRRSRRSTSGACPTRSATSSAARPGRRRRGADDLADIWFACSCSSSRATSSSTGSTWASASCTCPRQDRLERRTLLNSIGPVWDGNEVWLVARRRRAVRRVPARLRLPVLRLLPRVHARAAGDDPADRLDRVPEQGSVAPLAIGLGHGLRAGVGRAGASPRRRVRQHAERRAARRRRQHHRRPRRDADAVRPARRCDHGRDVRGSRRDLPRDEDRGRPAGADRARGCRG